MSQAASTVYPPMVEIEDHIIVDFLTRVIYEEEDGAFYWKTVQGRGPAGAQVGTLTKDGYLQTKLKERIVRIHRLVWRVHNGTWPSLLLDHIDGDKLNNHITNLREATHASNQHNLGKPKHNSSGFLGASFDRSCGKWRAAIKSNRQNFTLGYFDDPESAHAAYVAAKPTYHPDTPFVRASNV